MSSSSPGNTVGSLSATQHSVLVGSLLGDGTLRIQGRGTRRKNALLEVNHSAQFNRVRRLEARGLPRVRADAAQTPCWKRDACCVSIHYPEPSGFHRLLPVVLWKREEDDSA